MKTYCCFEVGGTATLSTLTAKRQYGEAALLLQGLLEEQFKTFAINRKYIFFVLKSLFFVHSTLIQPISVNAMMTTQKVCLNKKFRQSANAYYLRVSTGPGAINISIRYLKLFLRLSFSSSLSSNSSCHSLPGLKFLNN